MSEISFKWTLYTFAFDIESDEGVFRNLISVDRSKNFAAAWYSLTIIGSSTDNGG